jgi:hypothetical protein
MKILYYIDKINLQVSNIIPLIRLKLFAILEPHKYNFITYNFVITSCYDL